MQKLENPTNAPQAFCALLLQSLSEIPTVSLSLACNDKGEVKIPRRPGPNDTWIDETTKRIQVVSCVNEQGEAISIEGQVNEAEAVTIQGAFKVLLLVRVGEGLKGAFDKGAVSKSYASLTLIKVVEVWSSPTKRLWSAPDWAPKAGKTFDMSTGKVAA